MRSALHACGYRFRKNVRVAAGDLQVRPDIVFPKRRVAVFLDGCFWHHCPAHGNMPNANSSYWRAKLQRNVERDSQVEKALAADGWTVVRIWEHVDISHAVEIVQRALIDEEATHAVATTQRI